MFTFLYSYRFCIQTEKRLSYKSITKRSVKRDVKQKNMIKNKPWKITVQCKLL